MYLAGRHTPREVTFSSGFSNGENVLLEDANYAVATATGGSLILDALGFDDLPDTVTIKGIAVRLDAYKEESSGSGDLRFEVDLFDGVDFNTSKETPLLTSSNASYVLGGPDDDWGGSWTRTIVAHSGNFAVRLQPVADGTPTGTPDWRAVWVTVSVFYTDDEAATLKVRESLSITEELASTSIIASTFSERIGIQDSGSQGQLTRMERRTGQLAQAGTAKTVMESDSDFSDSTRPGRAEALGAMVQLAVEGPTLFVGDATITFSGESSFPYGYFQPGLLSIGDLSNEAAPVSGVRIPSCEVRLANIDYVDQADGSDNTPKTIGEHTFGLSAVGRHMTVWGMVESGDGWKKRIVFNGEIEDIDFNESEVILRGVQVGTANKAVPDITVNSDLFTYASDSVDDSGQEAQASRGKPVPIGLGRFDYGAVKKPADFTTGHPFRFNAQGGSPSEDQKTYSHIALFPGLMGLKHPMMPAIHVAKRWRRTEAEQGGATDFLSWPWQNVYMYGSRKSGPHLGCLVGDDPAEPLAHTYPNKDTISVTAEGTKNVDRYRTLWTWVENAHGSFGLPIVAAYSTQWFALANDAIPDFARKHVAGGSMDVIADRWTDGNAQQAFAVFTNNKAPRANEYYSSLRRWPGVMQAVALPMAGVSQIHVTQTRVQNFTGSPKTPYFTTSLSVVDPRNCIDLDDPESYTRIPSDGRLTLQCPTDGPNLGKMMAVRICMLWNNSTSTATSVNTFARFGPIENYAIRTNEFFPLEFNVNKNVAYDGTDFPDSEFSGHVPNMELSGVSDRCFASFWVSPYFDPSISGPTAYGLYEHVDPSAIKFGDLEIRRIQKYIAEWKFIQWDRTSFTGPAFAQFPTEVMFISTGGLFDLIACWQEVVYESPLNGNQPEPITAKIDEQFQPDRIGKAIALPGGRLVPGYEYEFPSQADPSAGAPSLLYISGKGAQDDASGTITGTANKIIEHPTDMALALIRHYLGHTVFNQCASGSNFGSFATARTALENYRLSLVYNPSRQGSLKDVLRQIADQSRSVIRQRLDSNGDLQWCMIPDVASPDASRTYAGFIDGQLRWDNLTKGSFRCYLTPYESLAINITLRYGRHLPTSSWSGEIHATPESADIGSTTQYTDALTATKEDYRIDTAITIDAPDVWDIAVARLLLAYHVDRVYRRRIVIEFETFINGIDIEPGHVVTVNNEIGDRVPLPGGGYGTDWDDYKFIVTHTSVAKETGQLARVYVRAMESITSPPVPAP